MIPLSLYEKIKNEYINSSNTITALANKYCVNRKKLSYMLKHDGIDIKPLSKLNKYTLKEIGELLDNGLYLTDACKIVGVNKTQLSRLLGTYRPKNLEYIEHIKSDIIKKYEDGASVKQLAKEYNCKATTMSNWLKYLNVTIRPSSEVSRIYTFNNSIFKVIDSEEKAYWLGFLYADGYVSIINNYIELRLKASDLEHLENFKAFMESTSKIKQKEVPLNGKKFLCYYITINSKSLVEDLIKLGCIPNKSLKLTFPQGIIPNNLMHHFIRGYFDGDGNVYYSQNKLGIRIYSTEEFLIGIRNFLNMQETKLGSAGKAFVLQYGGNQQTGRLFSCLYKDATIYLNRKYKYFIETPYFEREIFINYLQGNNIDEITSILSIQKTDVISVINKLKLNNLFSKDQTFNFSNDENTLYLLGYITGAYMRFKKFFEDLNLLIITASNNEELKLLEQLRNHFKIEIPITNINLKFVGIKKCIGELWISNNSLVQWLRDLKYLEISDDYFHYFLRGYFDNYGAIGKDYILIGGNEIILSRIKEILCKNLSNSSIIKSKLSNGLALRIRGTNRYSFLKLISTNTSVMLMNKYEKVKTSLRK